MTDQIQLSLWTVLKVAAAFLILLVLLGLLTYQAFFKPKVIERERKVVETNYLIRERLKILSNERIELGDKEKNTDEKIRLAGSITNAPNLEGAVSNFYALYPLKPNPR